MDPSAAFAEKRVKVKDVSLPEALPWGQPLPERLVLTAGEGSGLSAMTIVEESAARAAASDTVCMVTVGWRGTVLGRLLAV